MPRILLVEDNELNRDMLARRLVRSRYEVLFAEDGEQAVRVATHEQPDLILMDLSLPIVDGWTATRQLRMQETTRRLPIIALTSHAMAADRDAALAAGCDDYATKPIDYGRLLAKIQALLPT